MNAYPRRAAASAGRGRARCLGILIPAFFWIASCIAPVAVGGVEESRPDSSAPLHVDCIKVEPRGVFNHMEFGRISGIRVPGEIFPDEIQETVDNLLKTRKASAVIWKIVDESCGRRLVFTLELSPFIKRLSFTDNRQIGDAELNRATDMHQFGEFSPEILNKSLIGLQEYYVSKGFPVPKLLPSIEGPDSKGEVRIDIRIDESPLPAPASVDFVITGHPGAWWNLRLKTLFKYLKWTINRNGLNIVRINNLLKSEQRLLRENGYRNAEILVELIPESSAQTDRVIVSASLDKRVKIRFDNIGFFRRRDILHEWKTRHLTLSDVELERLATLTRDRLHEDGWLEADVTAVIEERDDSAIARVSAVRGIRRHISGVTQEGTSPVSTHDLPEVTGLLKPRFLGLLKTRPGPEALERAGKAIRTHMENLGYSNSDVSVDLIETNSPGTSAKVTIESGEKQVIGVVDFQGADNINSRDLKTITHDFGIKSGKPYVNRAIRDAMTELTRSYWRHGYSDMSIRAKPRRSETGTDIIFEVKEGPAYIQGPLLIAGNVKTRSSLVYRLEKIVSGRPFRLEKAGTLQEAMYQTGVFDSVTIRTEKHPEASPPYQTIIMDVMERSTGEYETGIDFNTDRGFEGIMEVGERNLFGRALNGRISGLLGQERWTVAASLQRPVFWGHRLENRFRAVYADDRTNSGYDLRKMTFEISAVRRWRNNISLNLSYAYERENVLNIDPDISSSIEIGDTRSGSLTPLLTIDRRDDPFRSNKGWFYQTRLKNSLTTLGTESEFVRWDHDTRLFIPFDHDKIVLGMALRGGRAWVLGNSTLPASERFYLGGASTNRGFEHQKCGPASSDGNPLGGESYLLANLEMRFPIVGNFKGAVFVDAGNVFASTPETPYLRPSAGVGVRYSTPIGPLRCDIGWNLDPQTGEPGYAIQAALGHAF